MEGKVEVIPVDTLDEVMEHALIKHEQKAAFVERLGGIIDRLTLRCHPTSDRSNTGRGLIPRTVFRDSWKIPNRALFGVNS